MIILRTVIVVTCCPILVEEDDFDGGDMAIMTMTQVCPWTLFLTMSLTLLKGLMPHVPAMLPLLVSDPEMRSHHHHKEITIMKKSS